jgi:hypothetical protein
VAVAGGHEDGGHLVAEQRDVVEVVGVGTVGDGERAARTVARAGASPIAVNGRQQLQAPSRPQGRNIAVSWLLLPKKEY